LTPNGGGCRSTLPFVMVGHDRVLFAAVTES
jgi:hypothetical protein